MEEITSQSIETRFQIVLLAFLIMVGYYLFKYGFNIENMTNFQVTLLAILVGIFASLIYTKKTLITLNKKNK
ncbi:hypothetical protein C0585_07420 [Candidatus Woesearchaeota archaeon]|nr:MAG: hypothetical protein C0585_07420 [Candidatus Woesearchaeota archaeon]